VTTTTAVPAPCTTRRRPALLDQPRSVWAVAFAAVVAFMGIGLVDPILPTLAHDLDASPSQVSLLFTSYFAMTGLSMLVTGWVASRIGPRRTLLLGLAGVVAFSALAGASGTVGEIAGFRLGWGVGNALFIATALSVIVGSASGGLGGAIMLYEAALGLGIASGPLLGGLLGGVSWRGPFFGTATLMAIGFVLIAVLLERTPAPARTVSLGAPLRALGHPGLRSLALVAVLYNFGFFTVLAYTPFPMGLGTHALGLVFFGWGLLLALTSVFGAQRLERRFGLVAVLTGALLSVALLLVLSGALVGSSAALAALVIVSGGLFGIVNTVLTEAVMAAAAVERPVASAAYSFVRFTGGAIAPFLAGKLGEHVSAGAPLFLGAGMVALSAGALTLSRRHIHARAGEEQAEAAPAAAPRGAALAALGDRRVVTAGQ
jgi:MFS transporter, ACDE family, multidrug resistance protein